MDVLITSASRPESLKSEMGCFKKHIKYSGEFNFHLHEDVVPGMEEKSKELADWAWNSGIFTTVYVSNPRIGRGLALNKLRPHATSKYVWYLEDDWDFIEDVELDPILELMEKYTIINQIAFFHFNMDRISKPGGPNGLDHYKYARRVFDGQVMFVQERWGWSPGVWRRDFIYQTNNWEFVFARGDKTFNKILKKNCGLNEWNPDWLEKKIGAYFYGEEKGKIKKYTKHTAWDVRHDRSFL